MVGAAQKRHKKIKDGGSRRMKSPWRVERHDRNTAQRGSGQRRGLRRCWRSRAWRCTLAASLRLTTLPSRWPAGRIVGLIGPNGAGKTTLFNCLSRLYRPARGDIRLNGQSLRRCAASDIAALGIGRTFQASTLFTSMSVLDNVKVGAHARGHNGPLTDALTLPSTRSEEREFDETRARCSPSSGWKAWPNGDRRSLSLAARKRVELARALAGKPSLLLLDEPAGD